MKSRPCWSYHCWSHWYLHLGRCAGAIYFLLSSHSWLFSLHIYCGSTLQGLQMCILSSTWQNSTHILTAMLFTSTNSFLVPTVLAPTIKYPQIPPRYCACLGQFSSGSDTFSGSWWQEG